MAEVTFEWINDGEPFEMPDLPISGHRELIGIRRRNRKALSAQARSQFLLRADIIIKVKRSMDRDGVNTAMELWKSAIPFILGGIEGETLDWPEESFADNINDWLKDQALGPLEAETPEEALDKIRAEIKQINEEGALDGELEATRLDLFVAEVYWRLRSKFKVLAGPDGEELPFTRENIEDVMRWPSDAEAFYLSIQKRIAKDITVEEALRVPGEDEEEVIKKNVTKPKKASKSKSPPSMSSTEPPTGPTKKS